MQITTTQLLPPDHQANMQISWTRSNCQTSCPGQANPKPQMGASTESVWIYSRRGQTNRDGSSSSSSSGGQLFLYKYTFSEHPKLNRMYSKRKQVNFCVCRGVGGRGELSGKFAYQLWAMCACLYPKLLLPGDYYCSASPESRCWWSSENRTSSEAVGTTMVVISERPYEASHEICIR